MTNSFYLNLLISDQSPAPARNASIAVPLNNEGSLENELRNLLQKERKKNVLLSEDYRELQKKNIELKTNMNNLEKQNEILFQQNVNLKNAAETYFKENIFLEHNYE